MKRAVYYLANCIFTAITLNPTHWIFRYFLQQVLHFFINFTFSSTVCKPVPPLFSASGTIYHTPKMLKSCVMKHLMKHLRAERQQRVIICLRGVCLQAVFSEICELACTVLSASHLTEVSQALTKVPCRCCVLLAVITLCHTYHPNRVLQD